MDQAKIKATDMLTESLKLIVTIATIFFGGLLTYRSTITAPLIEWAYYCSLSLLASSSILSVININSLISKIYRGEDGAIKSREVKLLNSSSMLTLFMGIAFGAYFLTAQQPKPVNSQAEQPKQDIAQSLDTPTTPDINIIVGQNNKTAIVVKKSIFGKMHEELTITPWNEKNKCDRQRNSSKTTNAIRCNP